MKSVVLRYVFTVGVLLILSAGSLRSETIRIPASRDLWVSSAGGEEEGNNGQAPRLKLKGYQEFTLLDFDLTPVRGRGIKRATLHVKLSGDPRLRRVGVSTLGAEWVEGTGTGYDKEPGSSSFRWRKNPDTPWRNGLDYSDLTLVMFGAGGTLWSHAEASEPKDGWQTIDVAPKIVAARAVGLGYGFVIFDDTGTEMYREGDDGETVVFHAFPNRFFYSREQNAASAPVLELELVDAVSPPPVRPRKLEAVTERQPPGEAVISWEIPPLEESDILGFFVTVNGKELPRSLIPAVDDTKRQESQNLALRLRDTGLSPGENVKLDVWGVNSLSRPGSAATISFPVSGEPLSKLPGVNEQAVAEREIDLPKLGSVSVAILDEFEKITKEGRRIPERADANFTTNALWDGKTVRLESGRNEFSAFQIHLVGDAKSVRPTLRWKDAKNEIVRTVFYRFEYVESSLGKVPDPMWPLGNDGLDVKDRDTIYCEIFVPKEMTPGTRDATLRLESGTETLELDLVLNVRNFTLPDTLSFLPEMNCYNLPENERDYYRLAQLHRTYLNRVPYSHRGTVSEGCAPPWDPATKTFDFTAWDRRYQPYFDGSAFADLPRGAVPIEAFYLPLHENFPANIFRHYHGNNDGDDWADEVLDREYAEEFQAGCRDFSRHLHSKGWDDTCFHFFLNNKVDYKRSGWSHASSSWLLDEPAAYRDFAALGWFGRLFHEAVVSSESSIRYRCDISRPQWQRDSLDGLMGVNVVGGDTFHRFNRLVNDRKERFGEIVYTYGTTCRPEEGASQPVAWMLDAWTLGADGVVPWQTVGTGDSWNKSDVLALFYPGRTGTPPVVASHRLKAYRRGQQDVEYLVLLQEKMNRPRWDVSLAVRSEIRLSAEQRLESAEDAGTLRFTDATSADLHRLRTRIGRFLDERVTP